ncbi:MAG: hypothetical protein Q8Q60_03820 [Candidatus Chromulinivorax sp.]|nr:hypothetical protein [Candidatus Chromulinivorax sp.]
MKRIVLTIGFLFFNMDCFGSIIPGTLDIDFNAIGANPGYMNLYNEVTDSFAAGTSSQVLLQLPNGVYFIAASDEVNSFVIKMSADDVQDESFGVMNIVECPYIQAMLLLQSGDICAVGGVGVAGPQAGWMTIFSQSGEIITTGVVGLDAHYSVAQQANGRIIVAGKKRQGDAVAAIGAMIAYNSVTGAVDTTFGNNGYLYVLNQDYATEATETLINSIIVDATDGIIYYIYQPANPEILYGNVYKASPDGAATNIWLYPQYIFGAPVQLSTYLAFDSDGNVILTMSFGDRIYMQAINGETGQYYWQINFSSDAEDIRFRLPVSQPIVTSMIADENNNYIITGYDASNPNQPFVMRVLASIQDGLDTSFNPGGVIPGVQYDFTLSGAIIEQWNSSMINADGQITLAGVADVTSVNEPFLCRLYGDASVEQYLPAVVAGTPGNIDTNFGTNGKVDLTALLAELSDSLYVDALPIIVLPIADGSRYVAYHNEPQGTSFVARLTNGNVLDTTYGTDGISESCLPGVHAMIMDGNGCLVLIGYNDYVGSCWIARYKADNTGDLDPSFGTSDREGITIIGAQGDASVVRSVMQQSMGRYIVSGKDWPSFNPTLWAFTDTGAIDITFNSNSSTPGLFQANNAIYIFNDVIADSYDRLYVTARNSFSWQAYVLRLTSFGELDLTFNADDLPGIAVILNNCDDEGQIFMTFDAAGHIVVAAHTLRTVSDVTSPYISIAAVDPTGVIVESQLNIPFVYDPTITSLIATADGKLLLSGYQSDNNAMWVARVQDNGDGVYELDITFNPSGSTYGTVRGVMQFGFDEESVISRNLTSIAIYGDGTISIIGYEMVDGPVTDSFLSSAYDNPYTTQEIVCQNSKPIGTNDLTLGVLAPPANGFLFFATPTEDLSLNQSAQAIALQDDATIIVAIDGQAEEDGPSQIFMNAFDVDGLLNTSFNADDTPGQAVVLTEFDNQYVRDMMTFVTTDGVHKAILAGYATNTALGSNNSLLIQYDLDTASLDTSFGGYNGDSLGLAVSTGSSQGFTLGRQSMGRIILGGFNPGNSVGFLQGYTIAGLLDQSFGAGGYVEQGSTGLYVSIVDQKDRIIIAYNDGSGNLILARMLSDGSGLDVTFGEEGTGMFYLDYEGTLSSNNSFRIALDQDGTIFIVSILSDGIVMAVYAFNPDTLDTKSSSFNASDFGDSLSGFVIGKLLINSEGNLVIAGADASSILVAQITVHEEGFLILDPNFNASDTPGYLRYSISAMRTVSGQYITNALIHPDGRYIFVGNNPSGPV